MAQQNAVEEQQTQDPAASPGGGEPAGATVPEAEEHLKAERVQEELKAERVQEEEV